MPPALAFVMTSGPCQGTTLEPKGYCISVGRTKASKLHIKVCFGVGGREGAGWGRE